MISYVFFAAVFFIASISGNEQEIRQNFLSCVQSTGWSSEEFSENCAMDPPTGDAARNKHLEFMLCALKATEILKMTAAGVTINPENAVYLSAPGKAAKSAEIVRHCSSRAKAESTELGAATAMYTCFRNTDREEFTANCQAVAAAMAQ